MHTTPDPMSTTATHAATHKHIGDLHFDHNMWLNALRFYKDEIGIFEHRMEDIVKRNTGSEAMAQLEHFQNQYIRQREVIDELRHDIKEHENFLEKESMERPIAIEHRLYKDHGGLRDRFETFEKLYAELKSEFYVWATKWM
ncbi:MAG: hypothetical protein IPN85_09965 [Flavobacteriales bacterium]|nr:hypothetical protein [Flavobacteriales bacterium]